MTTYVQAIILLMESSLVASLVIKATFVMALALMVVLLPARRSRASLRHTFSCGSIRGAVDATVCRGSGASAVPILVSAPQQQGIMRVPLVTTSDVRAAPAEIVSPAIPRSSEFSLSELLPAGWLLGAMLFLLPVVVGLKQLRSLRRTAIPWQHGQTVAGSRPADDAGIHRCVEVLLHEKISGPTTYGAMRPVILLPMDAEHWDADDLNRALVHELEHVRRGDWMSHCLARVVCSVYWFHPLVWIVWRQFSLDAERACDDAVVVRAEATAYADQSGQRWRGA